MAYGAASDDVLKVHYFYILVFARYPRSIDLLMMMTMRVSFYSSSVVVVRSGTPLLSISRLVCTGSCDAANCAGGTCMEMEGWWCDVERANGGRCMWWFEARLITSRVIGRPPSAVGISRVIEFLSQGGAGTTVQTEDAACFSG